MSSSYNDSQTNIKRNKKKNKKSRFLRNVKGFAKQGIFGRGTHIDQDKFNYFKEILDNMNKVEDIEERVIMANNVFETTKESEVHLASNQIVSKALEYLVGFVNPEHLESYFEAFAENLRPICSDRFASHVLQKLLEIGFLRYINVKKDGSETQNAKEDEGCEQPLPKRQKINENLLNEKTYNLETEFTIEHKTNCGNFVLRVGKFMLNNLEDFVWDKCASHVMRACILCLAGVHVPKEAFAKADALMVKKHEIYEVPSDWKDVSKEFAERIEMWPQFNELPYEDHSSALLGVMCIALNTIDKKTFKRFGKKILVEGLINKSSNDEKSTSDLPEQEEKTVTENFNMPKVFKYNSSTILLETLLSFADPKLYTQIHTTLFAKKIALLAKHALTNYAVKKLIEFVKEKEEFESIFKEIHKHIEELLRIGHTALLVPLAQGCVRFQTKQAQLTKDLQSALHLTDDKERLKSFVLCVLKLKPYEIAQQDKSTYVNLHGSYLVQELLSFNKPIFIANCILEIPPDYLVSIFNNQNGSYICDSFLKSKFIGEKSRDKLIKHLEGFYVDLATKKSGSHVVELCFASAQEAQKIKIVKELAEKINMLNSSIYGRIVNTKLRVDTYRLSPAQWKASFDKNDSKAQQLFDSIIK